MITHIKKGDFVRHVTNYVVSKVIEVNEKFGWFKVQFPNGRIREYRLTSKGNETFTKLTPEQLADLILMREMTGITDFWYEG